MDSFFWVLKRTATGVAGVAALAYLSLLAMLYASQRDFIYHPTDLVPEPAAYGLAEMTAHRVDSDGGVRPLIWWAPPRARDQPVIVVFHGNGGHLGGRSGKARLYMEAGYGVLLAGYRYNAGAGGHPSEPGLLADARAAVEFAGERGYGPERLVFYGESLGTGVATAMAAEYGGAGLVLESGYSSVADVAQGRFWFMPVWWLVEDRFDSTARIGQVRAPILMVHGERDRTIPVEFGRKLLAAAPEPKEAYFLADGTHVNLYRLGAGRLVLEFLARRVTGPQKTATAGG